MKRLSKCLSMCLAVLMLLTAFPTLALAEPAQAAPLTVVNESDTITGGAGGITVTLSKNFPSVIGYEMASGKKMDGQTAPVNTVSIGLLNASPANSWKSYTPRKVEYVKDGSDNATYRLYIANEDGSGDESGSDDLFEITVNYKVQGNSLIIDTTGIVEKKPETHKLKSIDYPGNSLLSVDPSAADSAQLAVYWPLEGDINDVPPTGTSVGSSGLSSNWNRQYDRIFDLKAGLDITAVELPLANKSGGMYATPATAGKAISNFSGNVAIAILSNGSVAATMVNNTASEQNRFKYNIDRTDGAVTAGRVEDGRHYYRHDVSAGTLNMFGEDGLNMQLLQDYLPLTKIYLTEDVNGDETIDWQDGAIAYRHALDNETDSTDPENRGMTHKPVNNQWLRNSVGYINHNLNNSGSTFYRAIDIVKNTYNFTDGFGQRAMFKGYQAEGHDDSNSDYGNHFGIRFGGEDGFNKLIEAGNEYNMKLGVHINATHPAVDAYYSDARTNNGNGTRYTWVDPMTAMYYERDMLTGQLYGRLKELKKNAPGLGWIYLDVYGHGDYVGRHTMQIFEENDWMIMTEFGGPMQSYISAIHWGSDLGYPGQTGSYSSTGEVSQLKRFIYNDSMDSFEPEPLLRGSLFLKLGAWRGHDYTQSVDIFNAVNLPTKYLQHFELMKYENGNQATFTSGVKSVKEGDRTIIYGVDGKKIADLPYTISHSPSNYGSSTVGLLRDAKIFIPWTEEVDLEEGLWDSTTEFRKAYAYSYAGSTDTWEVPAGWSGGVELYKLSDNGREKVSDIEIIDGKITLTLAASTGYVVYPTNFDVKKVAAAANYGEEINFPDNGFDTHSFDYWQKSSSTGETGHINMALDAWGDGNLFIDGNSPDATVWQDLTVTPGKNHTAAIWVKIGGNNSNSMRKTKLIIEDMEGNVLGENFITRNVISNYIREHVYYTTGNTGINNRAAQHIHPLRVRFTAPEDGKIRFKLVADATSSSSATVYFDWASVTEFLTDPGYDMNDPKVVFYENFENADQNWGLIEYAAGHDMQTHLAGKIDESLKDSWYVPTDDNIMGLTVNVPEAGLQPFTFVIDGSYSLISHEGGTGEVLRTLPQSLRLEARKTYKLSFDYKAYTDTTAMTAPGTPIYAVDIKGRQGGGSYVSLARQELENTVKAYAYSNPGYMVQANEPAAKHVEIIFETGGYQSLDDPSVGDIYLTFSKLRSGYFSLILDNIKIEETDEEPDPGEPTPPAKPDLSRITPSSARANSQQNNSDQSASLVLDENAATHWHSVWTANRYPYYLEIDLGKVQEVKRIELDKRADGGTNGVILAGKVYSHAKTDSGWPGGTSYQANSEWIESATITTRSSAGNVPATDVITFAQPITTRYIRIDVTTGSGGYASLGGFRAYGEEKTPASVSAADVNTLVGNLPTLPAKATLTFTDSTTDSVDVSWPKILMRDVASPGSFQITGVTGLDAPLDKVTISITVNSYFDDVAPSIVDANSVGIKMNDSITSLTSGNFEVYYNDGTSWIKTPFAFGWSNSTKTAIFTVTDLTQKDLKLKIKHVFADEEKEATIANRVFVTATAGPGGSISPGGTTSALAGDSPVFTITSDSGYVISDVLVNGASLGKISSYTFENIQADSTIEAVFTTLGDSSIQSVGYSGFTQLISGYTARIPVTVSAINPDGLKIYAGLFVDGILVGETVNVTSGSASIIVPKFSTTSASASLRAWFEGGEANAVSTAIPVKQLPANIWKAEILTIANGNTVILFGDDIALAPGASVTMGGNPVEVFSAQGPVLLIEAEAAVGDVIEMKGIKYPNLFPSYSFTFKVTR